MVDIFVRRKWGHLSVVWWHNFAKCCPVQLTRLGAISREDTCCWFSAITAISPHAISSEYSWCLLVESNLCFRSWLLSDAQIISVSAEFAYIPFVMRTQRKMFVVVFIFQWKSGFTWKVGQSNTTLNFASRGHTMGGTWAFPCKHPWMLTQIPIS